MKSTAAAREPSWFLDAASDQPHDHMMARHPHPSNDDDRLLAARDFGGEDAPFRYGDGMRHHRRPDAPRATAHRRLPRRRNNDPETAAALQSDRSTLRLTFVATIAGLVIGFGATQISRFQTGTETAAIQPAPGQPAQPATPRPQVRAASETVVQKAPVAVAAPGPAATKGLIPPPQAAASAGLQKVLALQIPAVPEAADPLTTGSPPAAVPAPPAALSDDPATPSPIPQPVSTGIDLPGVPAADTTATTQPASTGASLPDAPPADSTTIAQGNVMLEAGDAEAAREYYLSAYKAGQSGAALGMARSYDPLAHAKYQVNNGKPDSALALQWYERAAKTGEKQAFAAITRLKTKQ